MASPLRVYVVDDTADYRLLIGEIFKRYFPNYSLYLFANGQAFLDELPQMSQKPNLVLLDQHMPQLDGYQILMALKRQPDYRSIPVVMMSSDASHSETSNFYEAGAATFLTKATDLNGLKEMLLAACQYANKPY